MFEELLRELAELWKNIWELWKNIWGILGPPVIVIFALYFFFPEKFERIIIHMLILASLISEQAERRAISREVEYIISTNFPSNLRSGIVPRIIVEWGKEDKAISHLDRGRLVIVLRRGRKRHENVAMALVIVIPDLLAPEIYDVYDPKFIVILSAHIVRSYMKKHHDIIRYLNEILSEMEKDRELRELSSMLIEIDDKSLFSRILLPELIKTAKLCYPHKDSKIDEEAREFIRILYNIVKGVRAPWLIMCGKYFKLLMIRVDQPGMLQSYIHFAKHALEECPEVETICILAEGKDNIAAAKALKTLIIDELRKMGRNIEISSEDEYVAPYKGKLHKELHLYICEIEIESIGHP